MGPLRCVHETGHPPEAASKIVFDKFHIAKHLSEAVDQVRREENKQLRAEGNDRLVGTKFKWLRHPDHFTSDAWHKFKSLRDSRLKTAHAWALKETATNLFTYSYTGAARSFFMPLVYLGFSLPIEAGCMLKRRLDNTLTFTKHPITNAASESLNAKIQSVKYTARGFHNQRNFIHAIYFHCGGLDLAP